MTSVVDGSVVMASVDFCCDCVGFVVSCCDVIVSVVVGCVVAPVVGGFDPVVVSCGVTDLAVDMYTAVSVESCIAVSFVHF